MKIDDMTNEDIRQRMGADATTAEAREMMIILAASEYQYTEEIPDRLWFQWVGAAAEMAKS